MGRPEHSFTFNTKTDPPYTKFFTPLLLLLAVFVLHKALVINFTQNNQNKSYPNSWVWALFLTISFHSLTKPARKLGKTLTIIPNVGVTVSSFCDDDCGSSFSVLFKDIETVFVNEEISNNLWEIGYYLGIEVKGGEVVALGGARCEMKGMEVYRCYAAVLRQWEHVKQ